MQHVLDTGKRAFSAAVAAATIAFSIGAGVLLNPGTTQAASAGDLIRSASLSTVYYYGYDGMRYTFPNSGTYKSWYMTASGLPDFSRVMTVSDSTISDITLGGNVAMRPGTYWVKVQSDDKVYAVARNGMMHWIETEGVAVGYAGSDWNKRIADVPDVFFTDYTVGTSLMTSLAYNGMLYYDGGSTYLAWDGEKRLVSDAGFAANGYHTMFVMDGAGIDDSALVAGPAVTTKELSLVDAAQTEEGTGVAEGGITVSASSSMPAGASLPGGANSVEVFRFNVKAGAEAATFDGVTLSMIGAGASSNISNVYLYEGASRLTESRSINSSTRQVTFSNLNKSIAAGATKTYTVRVTISTSQTAADTFGFKIANAADVVSAGQVSGSFPITGNIFTLTGSDAGTLLVTKTGTISAPTIGEQDAEIGQFKIAANGSEAASITSITLKIDNASDHADFRLWDGNVLLDQGVNSSGDWVVFDLSADPFDIAEGGNNIFSVSADIGGQAADNVKVFVDNAVDVVGIGSDFGFGLSVDTGTSGTYDGASCTSSSGNCSFSTIVGGKVTIAFNGPAAGDIQVDSQDQVLLNFSVTASQFVTIKDLDIIVYGDDDADLDATDGVDDGTDTDDDGLIVGSGTNEAGLKDIKIVDADTGAVVMSSMELDGVADTDNDAAQTIDFTDDWSMEAGETVNLSVTADIDNNVATATAFAAALDISGLSVEDQNGDAIGSSDIVPGSDLTGYNQLARSASLVIALASTPSSTTTVDGTDNVAVVGFTMTAGDASDVTITDLTLSAYGDDEGTPAYDLGGDADTGGAAGSQSDINDYIESCSLYDGATLLAGPESPATNGNTIRFDTINWTLAHGAVKQMTVQCNFANTSTAGNSFFAFDIATPSSDVTVEDTDGDTFTATGTAVNGGTSPTRVVTLSDNGTLTVSVGSDTPSADFLLTSSNNNQVSTFRFTAALESFNVDTLTFSEEQAEDDDASSNTLATGNDSAYANNISLVTVTYPKADGTTGTATAGMSGNEARFSGLGMYVPVGSPKDVKVYVNVPLTDRDSGGSATSGEKVRMGLFVDTTNDDNFKVVGAGSGETLDDDNQGAIGDDGVATDGVATFVVKETKPVVTLSASSPSGSAVTGRSEVLRFNIAASANEDVVLNTLTFKINTTDNSTTAGAAWNECDISPAGTETTQADFDLYNLTDDGTTTTLDQSSSTADNTTLAQMAAGTNNPWTLLTATGALCTGGDDILAYAHLTLPTSEIVPKGVSKTFALYMDTTGASSTSDDSLRVDLPTDPITGTFLTVTDASAETDVASTDTTLAVDDGTTFAVGDVIVYDADDGADADTTEERMLVTAISTNTLTVVRGYLGSTIMDADTGAGIEYEVTDDILRLPGAMTWKDDGIAGTTVITGNGTADDYWGAYLVDNLTVSGGTLVF